MRCAWQQGKADAARERILATLRAADGYVSGEELSDALHVTRNTVWKHIVWLRGAGYVIDGTSRVGYRLLAAPDVPYPWEIKNGLTARVLGQTAIYLPSTTSTNDVAGALAKQGAPHGLLVTADEQTSGKGRRGHTWVSPAGRGLWLSLVWRLPLPPTDAPQLTLLTAVSVAKAIRRYTGLPAGIKWPNDILIGGRKVCGVLLEMSAESELIHHLVVGIGINVLDAALPPEVSATATSLEQALGRPVARVRLLQELLAVLEADLDHYQAHGPGRLFTELEQLSVTLGQEVTILGPDGTLWAGSAVAIERDGALRVRAGDGSERLFHAGEVSVRPATPRA